MTSPYLFFASSWQKNLLNSSIHPRSHSTCRSPFFLNWKLFGWWDTILCFYSHALINLWIHQQPRHHIFLSLSEQLKWLLVWAYYGEMFCVRRLSSKMDPHCYDQNCVLPSSRVRSYGPKQRSTSFMTLLHLLGWRPKSPPNPSGATTCHP